VILLEIILLESASVFSMTVLKKPEATISGVFLYAENASDKIPDRFGTLKGLCSQVFEGHFEIKISLEQGGARSPAERESFEKQQKPIYNS